MRSPFPTRRSLVKTLYHISPIGNQTLILFDIKLLGIRRRILF